VGSESSENAKLRLWTHLGGESTREKTGRHLGLSRWYIIKRNLGFLTEKKGGL